MSSDCLNIHLTRALEKFPDIRSIYTLSLLLALHDRHLTSQGAIRGQAGRATGILSDAARAVPPQGSQSRREALLMSVD